MPRSTLIWIAAAGAGLAALFFLWRFTPLNAAVSAGEIARWAREFRASPWAVPVVLLAYTPASLVMFPRPLITIGSIVAFGPWLGSTYALAGVLLSGLATYVVGRMLSRRTIRRFVGEKLYRAARLVRRGGIAGITAVRLVPIAPFIVINMIAGAARVALLEFSVGTVLGMTPGVLGAALVGTALRDALEEPAEVRWGMIAAIAAFTLGAAILLHRFARRSRSVHAALGERR